MTSLNDNGLAIPEATVRLLIERVNQAQSIAEVSDAIRRTMGVHDQLKGSWTTYNIHELVSSVEAFDVDTPEDRPWWNSATRSGGIRRRIMELLNASVQELRAMKVDAFPFSDRSTYL